MDPVDHPAPRHPGPGGRHRPTQGPGRGRPEDLRVELRGRGTGQLGARPGEVAGTPGDRAHCGPPPPASSPAGQDRPHVVELSRHREPTDSHRECPRVRSNLAGVGPCLFSWTYSSRSRHCALSSTGGGLLLLRGLSAGRRDPRRPHSDRRFRWSECIFVGAAGFEPAASSVSAMTGEALC